MTAISVSRSPLGMQVVAICRQRLRPVGIAVGPRERVVDEERKIAAEAPVPAEHESVVFRVRNGLELVDVAFRRVGSHKRVRERSIYVAGAKEVYAARVGVS